MKQTIILLLLILCTARPALSQSALGREIDLRAATAVLAGFTSAELLISRTNTLDRTYSNSLNIDLAANNNLCEATNDVAPGWVDENGTRELGFFYTTWDSTNLYCAVQADVNGSLNKTFIFLDTDPNKGPNSLVTTPLGSQINELNLTTGLFTANLSVQMWCQPTSSMFDGTTPNGSAELAYLSNESWQIVNLQQSSPYAWYNSATQTDARERIFMVAIPWEIIFSTTTNTNALSIRMMAVSAGTSAIKPAPIFDTLPQASTAVPGEPTLYAQDNWFSITVTDGNGAILLGTSPREKASVAFYPGSSTTPTLKRPLLIAPTSGATLTNSSTTLSWQSAALEDKQLVTYHIFLGTNQDFSGGTGPDGTPVATKSPQPGNTAAAWLLLLLPFALKKRFFFFLAALAFLIGMVACGEDPVPLPAATADRDHIVTNLINGKTYYWKIRAIDNDGYYIESDTRNFTTDY